MKVLLLRATGSFLIDSMCDVIPASGKPDDTNFIDMNCDPDSAVREVRGIGGSQCDVTCIMRCRAQRSRVGFIVCRQ